MLSSSPLRAAPPNSEEDPGNSTGSSSNRLSCSHSSRPGRSSRSSGNSDGWRRTDPCQHTPEGKPKGGDEEAPQCCSPMLSKAPRCCSPMLSSSPLRAAPPSSEEDLGNSTGSSSNRLSCSHSSRLGRSSRSSGNSEGLRRTDPCQHTPEGKPKGGDEEAPRCCSPMLSKAPRCCSPMLSSSPLRAAPPSSEEDLGNSTGSNSNPM